MLVDMDHSDKALQRELKDVLLKYAYDMDPDRVVANLGGLFFALTSSIGVPLNDLWEMARAVYAVERTTSDKDLN